MVLIVSSSNYYKKIPIGAGKIGSVMIPYKLSGMVCQSVYQTSKIYFVCIFREAFRLENHFGFRNGFLFKSRVEFQI